MQEKFVKNGEVEIQYIIVNYSPEEIPLIIIPGAVASADDIYNGIKDFVKLYCIIISIRGRGKSGKPVEGYSIDEQISDIDTVVKQEKLNKFYILGHSVGGGLASYYSIKHPEKIMGLMIADYPPRHPKFTVKWADRIKTNRKDISEIFINGIVRDSVKESFLDALANYGFKKLFLKAGKENSLLNSEETREISEKLTNTTIKIMDDCGHEMFWEKPDEVLKVIEEFMS